MVASHTMEKQYSQNRLSIQKEHFASLPNGDSVDRFILKNSNGIELSVINYGCIITSLLIPDRHRKISDIVLGFENNEHYFTQNNAFFGAVIGRFSNRIAKARFDLNGKTYNLYVNENDNHLHGGKIGFHKRLWNAEKVLEEERVGVIFSYLSPHMEEGYPGNLNVTVAYYLDEENKLSFEYQATCDKPTVINLTNHSYYNLSGSFDSILDHELTINAKSYLPVDSSGIPLDMAEVENSPFDFRTANKIGSEIDADHIQLKQAGGFDHCYILGTPDKFKHAARLYHSESGRQMDMYTTEPGAQLYTGNGLDGNLIGKGGIRYLKRSGLCLETQHYPDSPNRPDFPSTVLNPGEIYKSRTVLQFSAR